MNLLLWLFVGALAAWLGCLARATLSRQRLFIETVFAAAGALIGGLAVAPADRWLADEVHWQGLAAAALGAVALLVVARLRARGSD